jgi:hypothetical protein
LPPDPVGAPSQIRFFRRVHSSTVADVLWLNFRAVNPGWRFPGLWTVALELTIALDSYFLESGLPESTRQPHEYPHFASAVSATARFPIDPARCAYTVRGPSLFSRLCLLDRRDAKTRMLAAILGSVSGGGLEAPHYGV